MDDDGSGICDRSVRFSLCFLLVALESCSADEPRKAILKI